MAKILIVEKEPEIREVLVVLLELLLGGRHDIVEVSGSASAVKMLKRKSDIAAIICDADYRDEMAAKIYKFIRDTKKEIPFLLLASEIPYGRSEFSTFLEDHQYNCFFSRPFNAKSISDQIQRITGEKEDYSFSHLNPVRISFLMLDDIPNYDVFLKLSEEKYVKISSKGERLSKEIYQHYFEKDVKFVYIAKEDMEGFLTGLFDTFKRRLEKDSLTETEVLLTQLTSIESIHNFVRGLGVTDRSIEFTTAVINSIQNYIGSNDIYKKLFESKSDQGHIYLHSQIASYLITDLVKKYDWGSNQLVGKLIFACFFEDIALVEDEHAQILSLESEELQGISTYNQTLLNIKNHMFKGVEIIETSDLFSAEAKSAILNHHELPDGSGFPRGLTGDKLSHVDSVYIAISHFVHKALSTDGTKEMLIEVLYDMKSVYNTGHFANAIEKLIANLDK